MCIRGNGEPIIAATRDHHVKPNCTAVLLLLALTGCLAPAGAPVRDKLDASSGLTMSALQSPLEFLSPATNGARASVFAYAGPFDLDRMGTRSLYLWVLLPDDVSAASKPVVRCDGQALDLPAQADGLNGTGLTQPPYKPPFPWGTQWYLTLSDAALDCLAKAHDIALEIPGTRAEPIQFVVQSPKGAVGFPVLQAFASQLAN